MQPARPTFVSRRATSLLLALAVALAGLVGLGVSHPDRAAAAPPSTPTASPTHGVAPAAVAAVEGPKAVDDVLHLQTRTYNTSYDIPYAANDTPGAAPLKLTATTFPDDQPDGTAAADHLSVGFGDLGFINMLTPSSRMQFYGFGPTGTAVVRYRIVDTNGASAEALATVVVGAGGADVYLGIRQSFPGTADVLAGDIPGRNADGTSGTIDQTSVHFTASSGGPGSTVSTDGRTLTDPAKGVFTADPATGVVTFEPKNTYRGSPVHDVFDYVSYVARDTTQASDHTIVHHSYRVRIYLTVQPINPHPGSDSGSTPHHTSVTLPGLTDDRPGDPSAPLRPELTVFLLTSNTLPPGSTLFDHGRGLKAPGVGWWTIDADETITFTPTAAFSNTATVEYRLYDTNGSTAVGQEYVWVLPGPAAKPDSGATAQNVDVGVDVAKNDAAGRSADNTSGTIDRTTVHFPTTGQPAGATTSVGTRTLTVPREGVYTADASTGIVRFDPDPRFVGKASPVAYSIRDTVHRLDGRLVHNLATSTLSVAVTPITPVALSDSASTTFGRSVDIAVLRNDRPGAPSAPLVPSTVRLSNGSQTLTVAGFGTYVARSDGVVVFTPARGFTGNVPAVGYRVSDANGTVAAATITVQVTGAAVLRPTTATTRAGQPVVVDVLSNDDPPSGAGWDRSSVCVVAGTSCLKHATRPGVGSWTVDDDGTITFASASGFLGDARVAYAVHDTVVGTYTSTLTVIVAPAREARND
jgi:CshA-type fibril repeat protein